MDAFEVVDVVEVVDAFEVVVVETTVEKVDDGEVGTLVEDG